MRQPGSGVDSITPREQQQSFESYEDCFQTMVIAVNLTLVKVSHGQPITWKACSPLIVYHPRLSTASTMVLSYPKSVIVELHARTAVTVQSS